MAQCKQMPQEFIKNAFTPQIAVMSTPLAEKCWEKNNLNFVELLQPFSRLQNDVHFTDSTGTNFSIKNLKLTFLDVNWKPPPTTLARILLNTSVSSNSDYRTDIVQIERHKLDIPSFTPWYENWRDIFFKVQYPSDHEFSKHFLACILVISSFDNVDIFGNLEQNLNKLQNNASGKLPKWFNSTILKYYVIVHDNFEGSLVDATKSFETIKATYEAGNCFLLKVNSRCPLSVSSDHLPDPWSQYIDNNNYNDSKISTELESPKEPTHEIAIEAEEKGNILSNHPLSPANDNLTSDNLLIEEYLSKDSGKSKAHGLCLSAEDVEQVKIFVYEFCKTCLIPYVEKQINTLNEQISNKKGVSKSLFSATKRWFSTNKPGLSASTINNLIYAPESQELHIRRLGDLYFMFGHYSAAFNAYHMAKRDYNADQAWLYYAGALEMASLSAFMANETSRKTFDYMEESITIYLNTCKMPQFATRGTVLSLECLKHHKMYGEAAHQLIRMTSEDSDLRSALLLEQAAFCFFHTKMVRKYAFHMVLAGHRFSKASQRHHSLKCYKQAYQVYQHTRWDLACDHIHYTIGKQANNLQLYEEAVESFSRLLKGESKQSATQQSLFLKEYLTILGNKRDSETGQSQVFMPILPVPCFEIDSLKVLVGPTRPLSTPGKIPAVGINFQNADDAVAESKWLKLEEMLLQEIEGSQPVVFKPMITLYNISKLEKNNPLAIVNEPIQISIKVTNSLQTALHIKDIYLLWNFTISSIANSGPISNELADDKNDKFVKTHITKSTSIDGNSKQDLLLTITPLVTGTIAITGICYTLTVSSSSEISYLKGKQPIKIPLSGKQGSVEQKNLEITVVPPAPCLQVTFSEMSMDFLSDELQKITVDLQNISSIPLQNIYMATSVPHLLSTCEFKKAEHDNLNWNELNTPAMKDKFVRKTHTTPLPLLGRILEPGQATSVDLWMKAPNEKGPVTIDLLIYYENVLKTNIPKYRLIRHTWNLTVEESISLDTSVQISHNAKNVEELAFAIKITNLNKPHSPVTTEVTLLSVGLLSKNWTLKKDIVTPKYVSLHTQESAHILLKAKRSMRTFSEYSVIPLHSDTKYVNNLMNTYLVLAKSYEKPSLNIFKDDLETFVFKENKDGILLMQWQVLVNDGSKSKTVTGQCHSPVNVRRFNEDVLDMDKLISDPVIDINANEDNNEQDENQVSYNIICPPILRHNFQKETLCVVPVKLLLHSIVDDDSLSVIVNTSDLSLKATLKDSSPYSAYGSNGFCWLGNSKIIKNVQPHSSTPVHLLVALSGPGTFNLGANIEVLCKKINQTKPHVLQYCKIHSTVIVVNMET